MGARPSSFRKGGGFLHEVDATIVDYNFFRGETVEIKRGDRKGEEFTPLSLEVAIQQDGADAPVTKRLLIADADLFGDIEDDGKTLLTPDGQSIGLKSEAGTFISSLCEGGFPEENFSEDEDRINFEPMIGTRVRLLNPVKTKDGKPVMQRKPGKDGKQYAERGPLQIQTVHTLPEVDSKPAKAAKGGKSKGPAIDDIAADVLRQILEANKGELAKSKLSVQILKTMGRNENRDAVKDYLTKDDNLSAIEGVTYNAKKGLISLEAEE
jgi:hypothetical protein